MQTRRAKKKEMGDAFLSLPEEIKLAIFSHFDVKSLIEKKRVCQTWLEICTAAINAKQTLATKRAFENNEELCLEVRRYCGYEPDLDRDRDPPLVARNTYGCCEPDEAEEIAQTYGWPINRWDVSQVEDLSCVFDYVQNFNEDISLWVVSQATTMERMFAHAVAFDQELSSWDVSNVTDMSAMFLCADAFNRNIRYWNVSKVTNMFMMFDGAETFNDNQDVDTWENWNTALFYDL